MRKAGLSEAFIREKWTTHQIGGQYIAPEVEEIVPKIIQDQTTLITRLASEDLQRIQTAVVTSLDAGVNINDLEATLRGISGFSPRKPTEGPARSNGPDKQIEYNGPTG